MTDTPRPPGLRPDNPYRAGSNQAAGRGRSTSENGAALRRLVTDTSTTRDADAMPDPLVELRLGPWSADCPDIPAGFVVPHGWACTLTGIHRLIEKPTGTTELRVAYGPVVPVAIHSDPGGAQLVELVWHDGVRWINRLVPRAIAKSGRKLIAEYGDYGLPATESTSKDLERWLAAVEAMNRHLIPRHAIARWLGWQDPTTFLSSADDARIEVPYQEQLLALRAHRPRGTLDGWQVGVAAVEDLPVAKMPLYAGFAATLLDVVDVDSFTIDLSGRSTRGKTTAAKIGLSLFADPSEKGDGALSWRTTVSAIEKRLNLVRGLPVLLDETRVVTNPEIVNDLLYQISKNHGKARSGGYPSLLLWSTIVLSTGEQPALSFTSHQGASARVLQVTRPPFGVGSRDHGEAAIKVGRAVDLNYGHAGPLFVSRLIDLLKEPGGRERLVKRHRWYTGRLAGSTDLSQRRAPLVSCLALAAELAHEWGILPGLTMPPEDVWLEVFTAEAATDNRAEMALDAAREYIAANGAALWYPKCDRRQPAGGWIGRTIEVGGLSTVALLPGKLREAFQRQRIDLDSVLPGWIEQGWLVAGSEEKHRFTPKHRLAGGAPRMLVFQPVVMDGDWESDPDPDPVTKYVPYTDVT
jgi:hypothetical protein